MSEYTLCEIIELLLTKKIFGAGKYLKETASSVGKACVSENMDA